MSKRNKSIDFISILVKFLNILLSFPSLFLISFLLFYNNKNFLILSYINLIISGFFVIIIKNIVKKRRPDDRYFKKRLFSNHYSMPSGHLSSNISLFFLLIIFHSKFSYIFLTNSILIIIYKLLNKEHDFYDLFFAIFVGLFSAIFSSFSYFNIIKFLFNF